MRARPESPPAARTWPQILLDLTKARLVSLVVVTTGFGYAFAGGELSEMRFAWTLLGTALMAAGSMALNEWAERDLDARMERTRARPLPAREVSPAQALAFGVGAALTGALVLLLGANPLTALLGVLVVALYVLVYTPLKTRSTTCTLVGAVCGALPPMMGWTGASGGLAFGAVLLAAVLFLWQIPHFLALAWLYREDYERAGFRVLPTVDPGGAATTLLTNLYVIALLPIGLVAALAGMTGWTAAAGSLLLGAPLLALGMQLARTRERPAARRLFLATLAYLPLLLTLMLADRRAPVQPFSFAAGPAGITAPSPERPLLR